MSLQGSLETIALPDVLSLLASSNKTGELRVSGRVDGQLWLQDGKFIASRVGLQPGHVEAVFQLLRLCRGDFAFEEGETPSEPGELASVDVVLRQAHERLTEWRVIEAAIPSSDGIPRLCRDAPQPEVTLRADQWRMVVAIGDGLSIRQTLEKMGVAEFDGCRGLKELMDAGLVTVEAPPARLAPNLSEPPRVRRRPLGGSPDAAPAAVALQTAPAAVTPRTPLVRTPSSPAPDEAEFALPTRPGPPAPPARTPPGPAPLPELEQAVAAAAALVPPADTAPAAEAARPPLDAGRARRARRAAAIREEVQSAGAPPPPPPGFPASNGSALRPHAAVDQVAEVTDAAPVAKVDDSDEPINRGLLLKFLSSVRS